MLPRFIGITGEKKSGKTTTIEKVIPQLLKKNLRIGTVKIAFQDVSVDINKEHYDITRHRKAKPLKTMFKSSIETAFFVNKPQTLREALKNFSKGLDLILIEGFKEDLVGIPQIALLKENNQESEIISDFTVAISSIPEFSIKSSHPKFVNFEELLDIILEKSLPFFPELDCIHCGFKTCNDLMKEIIANNRTIEDCEHLKQEDVDLTLKINDIVIPCNKFVRDLTKGVLTAILKNLKLEEKNISEANIQLKYLAGEFVSNE